MSDKRYNPSVKSPVFIPNVTKPPAKRGKVKPIRISGGNKNWGRK